MEQNVLDWYLRMIEKKNQVNSTMIKAKAMEYSNNKNFSASKGWLEKFKKKYRIVLSRKKRSKKLDKYIK